VSELDSPTHVVATLRDTQARLGEAATAKARRESSASAPRGFGHDISWIAVEVDTSFLAQVTRSHPGGII
jgi:hypothetical protein